MIQLQYFIHYILNSKYRLLFTLIIYIFIYVTIKNTHTVYCMTEGSDIPKVAEAKDDMHPSHQVQALSKEIKSFVGNIATLLEEKDLIIQHKEDALQYSYRKFFEQRDRADGLEAQVAELKEDLDHLKEKRKHITEIYSLTQENKQLSKELQRLTCELQVEKNKIANLRRELAHTKHVLQEDTYGDY